MKLKSIWRKRNAKSKTGICSKTFDKENPRLWLIPVRCRLFKIFKWIAQKGHNPPQRKTSHSWIKEQWFLIWVWRSLKENQVTWGGLPFLKTRIGKAGQINKRVRRS